ncbi:MAG: class I SAM-dependent methyltransferase [Pseudolabrys sp.]
MNVTQQDVETHKWFHSIDFGNGVVSKGIKPAGVIRMEANEFFKYGVQDKSVLDIGAWDGAYSIEAHRRGAKRVLATDYFCWTGSGWGKKANFDLAKQALAPEIEEKICDVFDLTPESVGTFDVVLFLGVLYHMKHPFLALERVAPLAAEMLIVETVTAQDSMPQPMMVFYPGAELNDDPTNWWAPNVACVKAMLEVVGFKKIEVRLHPSLRGKPVDDWFSRHVIYAWK